MHKDTKRWFGWVFWGFVGLFLLYLAGTLVITEYSLGKYEKIFNRVEHPSGTVLVDKVGLRVGYYPATYANDSIHFKSATLVGELRNYSGNWEETEAFYSNQSLEEAGPIAVIPIEIRQDGEEIWLDVPHSYIGNPGDYDILSEIREYGNMLETLQGPNNAKQSLYLVYGLWQ